MSFFANENIEKTWNDRYRKNGETVEENLRRVAKFCSKNKSEEEDFYEVMHERKFYPGGRTMSNSGVGSKLSLNNCFTCGGLLEDSMDAIFKTVALGAKTHQRGGGIGYDFSPLRPGGTPTSNDAIASGPISFMNVFNAQTDTILQGNRRGANMGVLNIYHPDIEEFIDAKSQDAKVLDHFNLSVMVPDSFLEAAIAGKEITLHWPVYTKEGYIEENPENWKVTKKIGASYLWDKIIRKAYDNGEPGVLFYDNLNKDNNTYYEENIVCTNPCGEYIAGTVFNGDKGPEEYGGSCNLGSIILPSLIEHPFTDSAYLNKKELVRTINTAVRFLDNIIDANNFPDQIFKNYQERYRTVGLGATGFSDMLAMLGIRYDSKDALEFIDYLFNFICLNAYKASVKLAKEKGSFPAFDADKFLKSGFIQKHIGNANSSDANTVDEELSLRRQWKLLAEDIRLHGIRNARINSYAPTGTMSMVWGNNCSSGIEPIFSLEYDRKIKIGGQSDDDIKIVHMEDYAYGLYKKLKNEHPECNYCDESVFVTAMDMGVDAHLDVLALIAKHTDMSVSKTINIPTDYTFEDTKNVYMTAWQKGIKGCTIFRPNALRPGVLISTNNKDNKENKSKKAHVVDKKLPFTPNKSPLLSSKIDKFERGYVEDVPEGLTYRQYHLRTGCGSIHLFIGIDEYEGKIYDIYTNIGSGGCPINTQANSRLLSAAIRGGIPIEYLIEQMLKAGSCPSYQYAKGKGEKLSKGKSCSSAIALVLKDLTEELKFSKEEKEEDECIAPEEEKVNVETAANTIEIPVKPVELQSVAHMICPECGENLPDYCEGGCFACQHCGWSKCQE